MWIGISILSGIALGIRNLLGKKSAEELPEVLSMWFLFVCSIPVVMVGFLFQPFEITNQAFWGLVVLRFFLDVGAAFTFYKALKLKAVTVVIPLLALQPILTLGTTFMINYQVPSGLGLIATILVAIGLTLVYMNESRSQEKTDFFKAAALVLVTVVCYSFLEPIHAKAISFSNLPTYLVTSQVFIGILLTMAAVKMHGKQLEKTLRSARLMKTNVSMGIALGLEVLFLFWAFTLAENVAYVISVSSVHILVTTLGATFFLREKITWHKGVAIGLVTLASVLFAFA